MSNRLEKPLTPKQQAFVREYWLTSNGVQSVLNAGYKLTYFAANVQARRLLQRASIQDALQKLRDEVAERNGVDQDTCIRGLHEEAIFKGEGSSHSARVSAWAHLANRLWPVPREKEQPASVTNNTLVLQGYSVDELRALLGKMQSGQGEQ